MSSGAIPRGLGLGCWELGGMGAAGPDAGDSMRMTRHAYDLGVRHFDTAQGYGGGASEAILGAALQDRRDDVCYASKTHAMSREEVKEAVEVSCRRLATGYIDIFYIHWPRTGLDLRPMMEGLEEARAGGKIRFIGVSNFSVDHMEQAGEAGRIDVHQLCYNLLWRYPERDVIPYCRERGIEVITYSTIAQGLLSDKTRGPETFGPGDDRAKTLYYRSDVWPGLRPEIEKMQAFARHASTPLSTLALQWVLSRPGVYGSLVGVRSETQIRLNVDAARGRLSSEVADELSALSDDAMQRIPDEGNIFLYYP
jgi:myo-inositol catabolism protein IolS